MVGTPMTSTAERLPGELEDPGVPGGRGERMLRQLRFLYEPCARFIAAQGHSRPVVLDVGTGSGITLERIRERLPEVRAIGLDLRGEPMTLGAPGLFFARADASALPLADQSIDFVVCRSSFCYCEDQPRVLREMLRVLRPGGALYIMDSTRGPVRRLLVIAIGMVLLRRSYQDMAGFADRALSRRQLQESLAAAGIADFAYRTRFLGTYFELVVRKRS